MSTLREAAQLALEALEYGQHSLKQISEYQWESRGQLAMDALKAVLAQQPEPAQEPLGYLWPTGRHPEFRYTQQKRDGVDGTPVYTTPQPQQPEPAQEPVAWMRPDNRVAEESYSRTQFSRGRDKPPIGTWTPLYTAPPQRKPLTDEEINRLWQDNGAGIDAERLTRIARAIERKVRGEA